MTDWPIWCMWIATALTWAMALLLYRALLQSEEELQAAEKTAEFWKRASDRKDTEIFELAKQNSLLHDWIKKKWGEGCGT